MHVKSLNFGYRADLMTNSVGVTLNHHHPYLDPRPHPNAEPSPHTDP